MNEIMEALKKAREKGHVAAVYRDETGDSWSGVPVLTGPSIAVLARERDFPWTAISPSPKKKFPAWSGTTTTTLSAG